MLFHFVEAPHSGVDVEQMVATFRGPAHPKLLDGELSASSCAAGDPALRSYFRFEGLAEPQQVVLADRPGRADGGRPPAAARPRANCRPSRRCCARTDRAA